MPTYEYACRSCGHRFDQVQSIHDDALSVCPECGGDLRKVMSPVGIHFKGSGFYRNDSRKAKSGTAAKTASPTGDSASSGESGSGEGTPGSNKGEGEGKSAGSAGPAADKPAATNQGGTKDSGPVAGGAATKSAGAPSGGSAPKSNAPKR